MPVFWKTSLTWQPECKPSCFILEKDNKYQLAPWELLDKSDLWPPRNSPLHIKNSRLFGWKPPWTWHCPHYTANALQMSPRLCSSFGLTRLAPGLGLNNCMKWIYFRLGLMLLFDFTRRVEIKPMSSQGQLYEPVCMCAFLVSLSLTDCLPLCGNKSLPLTRSPCLTVKHDVMGGVPFFTSAVLWSLVEIN